VDEFDSWLVVEPLLLLTLMNLLELVSVVHFFKDMVSLKPVLVLRYKLLET
jgi:hypothetical protein